MVPQLEHNSFEHRKQPRPKAKEKCCGEKFHRMQLEKKKKKEKFSTEVHQQLRGGKTILMKVGSNIAKSRRARVAEGAGTGSGLCTVGATQIWMLKAGTTGETCAEVAA